MKQDHKHPDKIIKVYTEKEIKKHFNQLKRLHG